MVLRPGNVYWKIEGSTYISEDNRFKIYERLNEDGKSRYILIDYYLNEFLSKPSIKECMEEAECRGYSCKAT